MPDAPRPPLPSGSGADDAPDDVAPAPRSTAAGTPAADGATHATPAPGPPEADTSHSVLAALRSPRRLRTELLAGLVVALALIPEAIAFSVIAGVDPRVGLFASFTMAVSIAFLGGRPAMISAATGAVALVVAPVAPRHGLDFLLATIVLAGVLQVLLGLLGVARLMRFVPRSVMVGFVNALAMLVFMSQVPHLTGVPFLVYPLVAAGVVVIVLLPRWTTVVPAPLVAVVLLTAATVLGALQVPTVGDEGELPESLPVLHVPDVPFTLETLRIIAPYALAVALVGLLESLLTAKLVDDVTDTHSDKTREAWGQGGANIVTGMLGGMGGCAVIGQTMMNVKISGARTRISTFLAGVFLLVLVVGLGDVVAVVPMAALVAVMIMVSVGAFDWHSVHPRTLRRMPRSETAVMLTTVLVTVVSHNLAFGVGAGVLLATLLFVRRVAHVTTVTRLDGDDDGPRVYAVEGALFFASSNDLVYRFDYAGDPQDVVIDLSKAHVWDASAVATLDAIRHKYASKGKTVTIVGTDPVSAERMVRMAGEPGGGH
ncbi:sulphate transporter [Cellulomonas flavigena DSM 20109]|uniref:Sulphate transporter n=1 Tax=Cellulomonas flavigena (strain ATCC 482 / DSM 20109 / BCRC 11376 / JCM 18109 / NBRC 3775 / NCIMB 8073 / NRS 134) TaxID=446466 RepID=D5UHW2_CELFN|nr:SulP family inorganic anion transporter [Cellulomonas flavigena]ADG73386.1 sulphate transporter [Cellulomonas flavigena DSM 20109]